MDRSFLRSDLVSCKSESKFGSDDICFVVRTRKRISRTICPTLLLMRCYLFHPDLAHLSPFVSMRIATETRRTCHTKFDGLSKIGFLGHWLGSTRMIHKKISNIVRKSYWVANYGKTTREVLGGMVPSNAV